MLLSQLNDASCCKLWLWLWLKKQLNIGVLLWFVDITFVRLFTDICDCYMTPINIAISNRFPPLRDLLDLLTFVIVIVGQRDKYGLVNELIHCRAVVAFYGISLMFGPMFSLAFIMDLWIQEFVRDTGKKILKWYWACSKSPHPAINLERLKWLKWLKMKSAIKNIAKLFNTFLAEHVSFCPPIYQRLPIFTHISFCCHAGRFIHSWRHVRATSHKPSNDLCSVVSHSDVCLIWNDFSAMLFWPALATILFIYDP